MARFRPEGGSSENTTPFGGFMEAAIVDFTDRSNEFDWAEVFIDVTMKTPASQYPVIYSLKGNFDKEDVNTHQAKSYLLRFQRQKETITPGTTQPEVFNILGQLEALEKGFERKNIIFR